MMTDDTMFLEAYEQVIKTKITYPVVDFPVRFSGTEDDPYFVSHNSIRFYWTEAGAGYVSERNTKYKYAAFTKLVRDKKWIDLEMLVNTAINEIKGAGRGLIFAMVDQRVVGVLRHYNMVDHGKMMRTIRDNGLASDVIGWDLNDHYLSLDLATKVIEASEHGELRCGIRIINGHSGHHALHYRMLVKSRGYEFTAPTYGRSRHLTGVGALEITLKDALSTLGTIKLDDKLLAMSVASFVHSVRGLAKSLTMRQESLLHLLETTELDNGMDAFVLLGQYASTSGYATAVSGLLDPFVRKLLGLEDPTQKFS